MKTELPLPAKYVRTRDGTRLRYFDSEGDGPPILLANGLGGPVSAWNPYVQRWSQRYRILSWDYRGLYGSPLPHRQVSLDISAHAEDIATILEAANVPNAAFFGWSMGVQVGLELFRTRPSLVSRLILINGTYGRPLHGVPLPFSGLTLPPLIRSARRLHLPFRRLVDKLSRSRLSYDVLRGLRLIAAGFERARFEEMTQAFESVDLDVYFALLERLHDHDGRGILSTIDVPTLVIAGTRDVITPAWLARRMAESIPHSEFFVVPGGTHYCAAEFPDVVAQRVEDFLSPPNAPSDWR